MNVNLGAALKIQLDLAFDGAPEHLVLGNFDSTTRLRLTKAQPWIEDLTMWIHAISSDQTLTCPDVVRTTTLCSMGLQFTDDERITALNTAWRKKPENTDVLSFPAIDETTIVPRDQCVELGDIVVSVPTARRQARVHNHLLAFELRWLVSHGLLHLLGWEHPNQKRLSLMLRCQEQLLGIEGNLQSSGDL